MDLCFLAFGGVLGCFLQQFSFPSVFVNPVSVSLLDLVVTLNGRSRYFVDPQLLNFNLRPELSESGSAVYQRLKHRAHLCAVNIPQVDDGFSRPWPMTLFGVFQV